MADSGQPAQATNEGIQQYYRTKIDELQVRRGRWLGGSVGTRYMYMCDVVCVRVRVSDAQCSLFPPSCVQLMVSEKTQNVRRLEAQRNELNAKGIARHTPPPPVSLPLHNNFPFPSFLLLPLPPSPSVRLLHEELQLLQEQGSHVGEVIKPMDKKKVLVKVREWRRGGRKKGDEVMYNALVLSTLSFYLLSTLPFPPLPGAS